jgi:hypothetical protein
MVIGGPVRLGPLGGFMFRKLLFLFFSAVFATTLTSQASAGPRWRFLKDYNGPDGGWLVLSLSEGCAQSLTANFEIESQDSGELYEYLAMVQNPALHLFRPDFASASIDNVSRNYLNSTKQPYADCPYSGRIFTFRMTPGHYSILFNGINADFGGRVSGSTTLKTSKMPFDIQSGKATYIGSINFVMLPAPKQKVYGIYDTSWIALLTDQYERDAPLATAKNSQIGIAEKNPFLATLGEARAALMH